MTRYIATLEIIKDYFAYRLNTGEEGQENSNCKLESKYVSQETLVSIRKLALKAEYEHRDCFDCYLNKILFEANLVNDKTIESKILQRAKEIANLLFEDNCINWGRIIILVSFITYLSYRYSCKVNNINKATSLACKLIEWLTSFITCKYGIWIECNGGWVKKKFFYFN